MAMPFHLVLYSIVMITAQCIMESCGRPTENLAILSVRSGQMVVLENGTILSVTAPPSLYSLIRLPYVFGTKYDGDHHFSLESVATKYQVCMNRTGKLYAKEKRKWYKESVEGSRWLEAENETRENRRRHVHKDGNGKNGKKTRDKLTVEHDECLFRIYDFNPNESYYKAAIYSVAHSTAEVGRFIAFGKDGYPRSLKRNFKNLAANRLGMLIEIHEPASIERLINNTYFGKNKRVNQMVRRCIHRRNKNSKILSTKRSRFNKVRRVIRKCRLKYDYTFRAQFPATNKTESRDSLLPDTDMGPP